MFPAIATALHQLLRVLVRPSSWQRTGITLRRFLNVTANLF